MKPYKNVRGNWQVDIEPKEMVSNSSFGTRPMGRHASTMELFTTPGGVPELVEWDIETLEETEHIGLVFDGKKLVDYDGIFEMPLQAIEFLEALGYDMSYVREDEEGE